MAQRFCQRCGSDVEDTGGFCLLGHRLAPAFGAPPPPPPPPAMDDLTAEVDRVFDAAQAVVQALDVPEAPAERLRVPSRYATSLDRTWAELESAPPPSPDDPINTFAPPPRMDWGPQRSAFRLKLRRQRAEATV